MNRTFSFFSADVCVTGHFFLCILHFLPLWTAFWPLKPAVWVDSTFPCQSEVLSCAPTLLCLHPPLSLCTSDTLMNLSLCQYYFNLFSHLLVFDPSDPVAKKQFPLNFSSSAVCAFIFDPVGFLLYTPSLCSFTGSFFSPLPVPLLCSPWLIVLTGLYLGKDWGRIWERALFSK